MTNYNPPSRASGSGPSEPTNGRTGENDNPGKLFNNKRECIGAVSYTHLTLPTNREV